MIYDGSKGEHGRDASSKPKDAHLELVEVDCISMTDLPHCQSRESGTTDLDLLPSRRLRIQDTDARVQPTNNPYHWEARTQSRNSNISPFVRASWTRTSKVFRQQAGTLKRKLAVRRSHKRQASSHAVGANPSTYPERVVPKFTQHRPFSFEDLVQRNNLSTTLEEPEEGGALSSTFTRVDSGVLPLSIGQSTHIREKVEERPRIARTFSEILGNVPSVPTALL